MRAIKVGHSKRNIILIIIAAIIIGLVIYKFASTYISALPKYTYTYGNVTAKNGVRYPNANFAVASDIHYYDKDLGTTGKAFEETLDSDRKLLLQSAELSELAVNRIINSDIKFLLVSGDLTKDGELINHQKVATQLNRIVDSGIKVYVVPGNHDVNNFDAVKYEGEKTTPVQNVSASDFAEIYKKCGYGDAIMRDQSSLSYVAQPQDGLWIVALDSCEYEKNKVGEKETVGGELVQSQIIWLEGVLKKANSEGKAVIVLEHHGVVEHWEGQSRLFPDYLLSDYKYVGKLLSSYGVKLAFTGHYHAQDITLQDNGDLGFIYDVETGSLITSPCPLRICSISNNSITIKTENFIDSFDAQSAEKAWDFVKKTLYNEAYKKLKKYYVSDDDANYISNIVAQAFIAHYKGDEDPTKQVKIDTSKLNLWGQFIYSQYGYVVDGLWKDLTPSDNTATLILLSK